MKKGKSKKSAPKSSNSNFGRDFVSVLSKFCAFLLLVIIILYFVTGNAMFESNQFFELINLDKELASYMHRQLTIPFCACMIIHILPSLTK